MSTNKAANEMVELIRDMVRQQIKQQDCTILCEVKEKIDENHYNVAIVPDDGTVISNIVNMTKFDLEVGDYVYVYKINNQLSNSFICYSVIGGKSASELQYSGSTVTANPGDASKELTTIGINNISYSIKGEQGPAGPAGSSNVILSIDNDFDSVPADQNGVVPSWYDWEGQTTHVLKVYLGGTQKKFTMSNSIPTSASGYTVVYDYEDSFVNFHMNMASDDKSASVWVEGFQTGVTVGNVNYTVYDGTNVVASAKFEASKLISGDAAVDYYMVVVPSDIKVSKDDSITEQVVATFYSKSGTDDPVSYSDGYATYQVDDEEPVDMGNVSSIVLTAGKEYSKANSQIIIKLYYDSAHKTMLDSETVNVIADGQDGNSAERLAIDNEFDSVPCSYEGVPAEGYDWEGQTGHTIKIFLGNEEQTFNLVSSLPESPSGYNIVYANGGFSALHLPTNKSGIESAKIWVEGFNDGVDSAVMAYSVYYGDKNIANGSFKGVKNKAGSPGQAAVDYYMLVDPANIKVSKDGSVTNSVTASFYSREGSEDPESFEAPYVTYQVDNGDILSKTNITSLTLTNGVDYDKDNKQIVINLYKDNTKTILYDTETILIVVDGEDGEDGATGPTGPTGVGSVGPTGPTGPKGTDTAQEICEKIGVSSDATSTTGLYYSTDTSGKLTMYVNADLITVRNLIVTDSSDHILFSAVTDSSSSVNNKVYMGGFSAGYSDGSGYLTNGPTSASDYSHEGIFMSTNGINMNSKNSSGDVRNIFSIWSGSGTIISRYGSMYTADKKDNASAGNYEVLPQLQCYTYNPMGRQEWTGSCVVYSKVFNLEGGDTQTWDASFIGSTGTVSSARIINMFVVINTDAKLYDYGGWDGVVIQMPYATLDSSSNTITVVNPMANTDSSAKFILFIVCGGY